jgi:hypothetical protein
MTSTSRTARCGPACRVVWQGRSLERAAPYADCDEVCDEVCVVTKFKFRSVTIGSVTRF